MEHPENRTDSSGIWADLTPTDDTMTFNGLPDEFTGLHDSLHNRWLELPIIYAQCEPKCYVNMKHSENQTDSTEVDFTPIYDQVGLKSYIFPVPLQRLFQHGFKIQKGTYIPYPFWHKFIIPNIALAERLSLSAFLASCKQKGLAYLLGAESRQRLLLKGAYSRKFSRVRKKHVRRRKVRIF